MHRAARQVRTHAQVQRKCSQALCVSRSHEVVACVRPRCSCSCRAWGVWTPLLRLPSGRGERQGWELEVYALMLLESYPPVNLFAVGTHAHPRNFAHAQHLTCSSDLKSACLSWFGLEHLPTPGGGAHGRDPQYAELHRLSVRIQD
mmetsp:Transcript_21857/g.54496  ORF Transcript_21857/g.54496 Transcript_21857/m.54496 type:complete len:146 (+) Transcript_21857:110-547(+)